MPELPEVETTRLGILPHINHYQLVGVQITNAQLRWPVPENNQFPLGQSLLSVERRAKYLVFCFDALAILIHLGMSGSLRIADSQAERKKHDHVEFTFSTNQPDQKAHLVYLRYHDPRRFGSILLTKDWQKHPLILSLGVEPLAADFDADYVYQQCQRYNSSIKNLLMNSKIVTGIGNIYANEALFLAGIHPDLAANQLNLCQADKLVQVVKTLLHDAIARGGTTLRDFVSGNGKPGYFQQELYVYGRAGLACKQCAHSILTFRQNNRATYWCDLCQQI